MENTIVEYGNQLNRYPMVKLLEVENDIYMALLSLTRFSGQTIEVNLYDLMDMTGFSRTSIDDFEQKANSLIVKICNPKISLVSDEKIVVFVCFDRLEYDRKTKDLQVHIQDDFYETMKNYRLGFTRFELAEFVNLSGNYAKTLYRLLKQFRSTGSWIVEVAEFRRLLDIPESYRQREIDTRVLKPCLKQLSRELDLLDTVRVPFRHLAVEKIKKKGRGIKGRGGTVTHYKFTFDAEKLKELPKEIESQAEPKIVAETAVPIAEK